MVFWIFLDPPGAVSAVSLDPRARLPTPTWCLEWNLQDRCWKFVWICPDYFGVIIIYIIFDITVSWLSLISLIITIWYYLHIGIVFFCGQFSDHHGFEPTLHWHISNPQNLWIYMTLAYLLGVNILTLAIRVPSGCQASPTRFSPVIWSRSSNLFVGTCCNMTNLTFNNFQQFKSFDDKLT